MASKGMKSVIKVLLSGSRSWWLSLLLWVVCVGSAEAAVELRVAVKKDIRQIEVGSSTTAIIRDASGREVGEITGLNSFSARPSRGVISLGKWRSGELVIEPTEEGHVWIGDRWYRGRTHLVRHGAGITVVNYVDIEDYLYSVVGAEAIASWPQEALKAQAVAARTYALHKQSESDSYLYDLDTTTKTQVYKGLDSEYTSTLEAVDATQGEVLTHAGQAILAVFHSSSGGHTENVEDIWSSPLPYLRGVVDYDQDAPVFEWTETLSANEIGGRIGGVGRVKALIPERVTPRGRVMMMKVVGDRGTKELSGDKLRKALDLRSTLFQVQSANGNFNIIGRGFGHGVGLSQWGAYYLSTQGTNYQQILAHYYKNASLATLD